MSINEDSLCDLLSGAIYAGIADADLAGIGEFFERLLGTDGFIEVISGSGHIERLALTFVMDGDLDQETADRENARLEALIEFLKTRDEGNDGFQVENIKVAVAKTRHQGILFDP